MNDVQRYVKLSKIKDAIGTSPATIRISSKNSTIEWDVVLRRGPYYRIPRFRVTNTNLPSVFISSTQLLTSQGWILPNLEKPLREIELLDAKKTYLIVEIYWRCVIPGKCRIIRTTHGVFKVFKNKLPERFYMAKNKKNHDWYERLTGEKYVDRTKRIIEETECLIPYKNF